jgi:hypothetical protein
MKTAAFWEIMPYGSVKINRRFRGTFFLITVCFMLVSCFGLLFSPEDGDGMSLRNVG